MRKNNTYETAAKDSRKSYNPEELFEMVKREYKQPGYIRIADSAWDYLDDTLDYVKHENETGTVTIEAVMEALEDGENIWDEADRMAPIMNWEIMEEVKNYICELEEVISECGGLFDNDFYRTAQYAIMRGRENEITEGIGIFKNILENIKTE